MSRKQPTPPPEPAPHISVRDWVLAVLDERQRKHAAEVPPEPPAAPEPEQGNLCACLVTFARWRRCCVCGSLTLFVNGNAQSDGDVECGLCRGLREELARQCRAAVPTPRSERVTCLPVRVALHMWALFGGVANENGRARA